MPMNTTPPHIEIQAQHRAMRLFLFCCGLILFVTMPNSITPGDCYASRAEAANLVMTGQWGIDYARKAEVALFIEKRGEYFFENDSKERLFNKWGIMNTILYLPPMLATRLFAGSVGLVDQSTAHLFFVNCNNVLLSMVILWYLDKIISLYTSRIRQRMLFITLAVFTTYLWFHLRAQMHEIFQVAMAVGFLYHYLTFLRAARTSDTVSRWRHLTLAIFWSGLLLLTKALFLTVFASAWLFAWLAGPGGLPLAGRLRHNLSTNLPRHLAHLLLPTVAVLAVFLAVNQYKTGSPFDMGYSQETFTGVNEISFSPRVLLESIPGFLLLPGNANVFLHFPLLILALFGCRSFSRRWPQEAAFLLFTVLSNFLVIGCYQTWRGEWTDGPRYLIIFAVMASLPAIETIASIAKQLTNRLILAGAGLFATLSLWSLAMQIADNSMENFSFYYYEGFFEQFHDPEVDSYFKHYSTKGAIYYDILAFKYGGKPFYPIEVLMQKHPEWPPEDRERLAAGVRMGARPNYFFVRLLLSGQSSKDKINAPPSATNG